VALFLVEVFTVPALQRGIRNHILDSMLISLINLCMLYFDDFGGFLTSDATSWLSRCFRTAAKSFGWNTPSANSSLVIFAGCFLNFGLFPLTI
jgi:hypothetical protein